MAKTVDSVTTGYVLDPAAGLTQVLQEISGGQTQSYLYGHDGSTALTTGLLAQYDSGTWAYHVNDGLGSVRQLADPAGQVVQSYGFSPFGVPLGESGGEPYGYTGEQWDVSTGLVFLRARYYQPGVGRFISKDPFAGYANSPQTLNGWSYALNNPANRVDPRGYLSNSVIAASFGVDNFEQVLTIFELNGRWGFLKLLQDARVGDIVEIGQEGRIYKRAGSFEVRQEDICSEKVTLNFLELPWFLMYLNSDARGDTPRNLAELHTMWRRNDYNWYFLNGGGPYPVIIGAPQYWRGGYTDWSATSDLPDFKVLTGAVGRIYFGGGGSLIVDKYGNRYVAGSFGLAGGSPVDVTMFEGYAWFWEYEDPNRWTRRPVTSEELRKVIEGWGEIASGDITGMGAGALVNPYGGAVMFGYGFIGGVAWQGSYTWWIGQDLELAWEWLDRVPGFGRGDILLGF